MGQMTTHSHVQTLIGRAFLLIHVVHWFNVGAEEPVEPLLPTNIGGIFRATLLRCLALQHTQLDQVPTQHLLRLVELADTYL